MTRRPVYLASALPHRLDHRRRLRLRIVRETEVLERAASELALVAPRRCRRVPEPRSQSRVKAAATTREPVLYASAVLTLLKNPAREKALDASVGTSSAGRSLHASPRRGAQSSSGCGNRQRGRARPALRRRPRLADGREVDGAAVRRPRYREEPSAAAHVERPRTPSRTSAR